MGQLQACGEPTVSGGQCGGSRRGEIKLERRNEHAGRQQQQRRHGMQMQRRSVSAGARRSILPS